MSIKPEEEEEMDMTEEEVMEENMAEEEETKGLMSREKHEFFQWICNRSCKTKADTSYKKIFRKRTINLNLNLQKNVLLVQKLRKHVLEKSLMNIKEI